MTRRQARIVGATEITNGVAVEHTLRHALCALLVEMDTFHMTQGQAVRGRTDPPAVTDSFSDLLNRHHVR